jgi:lysyl-tRNA synthetase class 2
LLTGGWRGDSKKQSFLRQRGWGIPTKWGSGAPWGAGGDKGRFSLDFRRFVYYTNNRMKEGRREKINLLRQKGIDPYGGRFSPTHTTQQALQEEISCSVKVAGRIISHRIHGRAGFAHIRDRDGRIQLYAREDRLGRDGYRLFKQLDLGDFIGAKGETFLTRTGEITIQTEEIVFLTKALRPLPEKWHGLRDTETRYRQRYLDLLSNEETRNVFRTRSKVIKAIREFLDDRGFLEVETPMMQPFPGGALARPFKTHHNALGVDLYLRIAPELYLKRLVIGGFERVYELSRNFRNEGISTRHNPEFTMLEVYQAYADYTDMMALAESLIAEAARESLGTTTIHYQGHQIDLSPPWQRKTSFEALAEYAGIEVSSLEEVEEKARAAGLLVEDGDGMGVFDGVLSKVVGPRLIQPTFVTDYPTTTSPLAKRKEGRPELCERFEIFIGGEEIGNAYSELNDPFEQRERFLSQDQKRIDEPYIHALEYGLPPTGGLGIGVDRLVMVLCNKPSIREVILFPQLRPEEGSQDAI